MNHRECFVVGGVTLCSVWFALVACGPIPPGNSNSNGNTNVNDNIGGDTGHSVDELPDLSSDDALGEGEGPDAPVPGLILVGFDQTISAGLLNQLASSTATALNGSVVDIIPDIQVITVAVEPGTEQPSIVLAEQLVSVDYAEADVAGRVAALDGLIPPANSAAFAQYQLFLTNAVKSRSIASAGSGDVTVAVLDTGCMLNHGEFSGGGVVGGANYIEGGDNVSDDYPGGHGTGVVSLLAAGEFSGEMAGLLPGFEISVHKVCDRNGDCPLDAVVLGVIGALNGNADQDITTAELPAADVITAGFSFSGEYNSLARAFFEAERRGVLVVAAAGNNGRRTAAQEQRYPAGYSTVISVGATDISDRAAPFSNRASNIDVVAPGVDLLVAAAGGGYGFVDGTSYSTAQVAAAVAWLLDREGSLTVTEVRDRLKSRGDILPADSGFSASGARRLNIYATLQDMSAPPEPFLIPDDQLVEAAGVVFDTLVAPQAAHSAAGFIAEAFSEEHFYWYGYFPGSAVTFELIDGDQRLPLAAQSVSISTIDLFLEFLRGIELGTPTVIFGLLEQAAFEMPDLGGARRAVSIAALADGVQSEPRTFIYNPLQHGYNILSYKNFDSAVLHLREAEGEAFNPLAADVQLLGFGARPEINWSGGSVANTVHLGPDIDPDYYVTSPSGENQLVPPLLLGECVGQEVPEQLCGSDIELPANDIARLVVRIVEPAGVRFATLDVIYVP